MNTNQLDLFEQVHFEGMDSPTKEELARILNFIASCRRYRGLIECRTIRQLFEKYQPDLLQVTNHNISVCTLLYRYLFNQLNPKVGQLLDDRNLVSVDLMDALEGVRDTMVMYRLQLSEVDGYYEAKRDELLLIAKQKISERLKRPCPKADKLLAELDITMMAACHDWRQISDNQLEEQITATRIAIDRLEQSLDGDNIATGLLGFNNPLNRFRKQQQLKEQRAQLGNLEAKRQTTQQVPTPELEIHPRHSQPF